MNFLNNKKNTKYDVVVLGRVAVDFNPKDINRTLDKSKTFVKYLGGSAGNVGVGLARHNLKVAFISCVSDDAFGTFVTDYLKKDGINTDGIQVAKNGEKIGLTFTEIKSPTESSILMFRKGAADLALEPNSKNEELIKKSKALLISGTALAATPSRDAVLEAISFAKKHNTVIIFDIDYRNYTWKSENETSTYYNIVAEQSDVIIGSRKEFDLTEANVIDGTKSDKKTADYYFNKNAKLVIIKHGAEGSIAYTKEKESYKVDIFPITFLKAFGGGDAYVSSMLYGLFNNKDLETSLTYATAAAANAVSSHSCSDSMLNSEELKKFIKKYQAKLPVVTKL